MADTVNFGAPKWAESSDDKFSLNAEALDTFDAALGEGSPYAPDNVQNLDANGVLSGLVFGHLAGELRTGASVVTTARGTVALPNDATSYVEVDIEGTVSSNTIGFTPGRIPLFIVVTDAADMTSVTDRRAWLSLPVHLRLAKNVTGAVDVTLSAAEALHDILEFSGALEANIAAIVPNRVKQWTVFNNTSGAYTLTVKTSLGTGVAVPQGQHQLVYCDGTNVVAAAPAV